MVFSGDQIPTRLQILKYQAEVKRGDELEVNLKAGTIKNLTTGEMLNFAPYPDSLLEIIEAGGLYSLLREKLAKGDVPPYARIPAPS